MKKDNLLDNCIRNDLKTIEKDMELMMLIWAALFSLGLSWGILFLAIPALIAVLACIFRIFRILCISSVYGRESVLYRSLPIPPSTLILSKIFTGGLVFAALGIIYYICLVFRALLFKEGISDVILIFETWIRDLTARGITESMVPVAAVLEFLNMAVRCFTLPAMVVTGTSFYHSLPEDAKMRYIQNSVLYIGTVLMVSYLLMQELPDTMDWIPPGFMRLVFNLVVSLAILAAGYKLSVYFMTRKDGGVGNEKK